MPRLVYPDALLVQTLGHRLALRFFPDYEADLTAAGAITSFSAVVRDADLLESALAVPQQSYYRGTVNKSAALLRSMVKNHPFVDGNKRLGLATTFTFLLMNRYLLVASNEEMVRFALALAASQPSMSWQEVAGWIRMQVVYVRLDGSLRYPPELKAPMRAGVSQNLDPMRDALQDMLEWLQSRPTTRRRTSSWPS